MLYISKGVIKYTPEKDGLSISRGENTALLNGDGAELWSNGRLGFSETKNLKEEKIVMSFNNSGLSEYESENTPVAKYRILTRCVCCPIKNYRPSFLLTPLERFIWN